MSHNHTTTNPTTPEVTTSTQLSTRSDNISAYAINHSTPLHMMYNGKVVPMYTSEGSEFLNAMAFVITKANDGMKVNEYSIASALGAIRKNKAYRREFDKFEEYAKETFGLEKAQANNLAKVGERFFPLNYNETENEEECAVEVAQLETIENFKPTDFSNTQLIKITRLTDEEITEAIKNGLNAQWTVKEIETFVKRAVSNRLDKKSEEVKETEEVEETEESDEIEEIEETEEINELESISKDAFFEMIKAGSIVVFNGKTYIIE